MGEQTALLESVVASLVGGADLAESNCVPFVDVRARVAEKSLADFRRKAGASRTDVGPVG